MANRATLTSHTSTAPGLLCVLAGLAVSACSSGSPPAGAAPPPAQAKQTTRLSVLLTSSANEQLTEFEGVLDALALTSASGNTITLLAHGARPSELIHINGLGQPLLTLPVPQDVYTSATITFGGSQFRCVVLNTDAGVTSATFAGADSPATVQVPAPLSVRGESMTVELTMLVSKSASYTACAAATPVPGAYAITPTFILSSPTSADAQATDRIQALDGEVSAIDAATGALQVTLPSNGYLDVSPTVVRVTTDGATVWQGLQGPADLGLGHFVDLDGALAADGSVRATRIAVADPSALNAQRGPLLSVFSTTPELVMELVQGQGVDERPDVQYFDYSGASFHTGGGFANLASLPFTPSFTAANMVPGQNVFVSSPRFAKVAPNVTPASTVTLMPQTINGEIVGVGSRGGFTVYTVQLAPYDLFAALATQPGQPTRLGNSTQLQVYVDSTTLGLSSAAPAVGDTLRFYGLIFNDNGALRMDCARISDGVVSSSQNPPSGT